LLNRTRGHHFSKDIPETDIMINKSNPFHELYVTESFGTDSFINLFSDVLIDQVSALFKPGNVILKGLPGTGKTMMLSLLEPDIRLAYHKRNLPFPIPTDYSKFVGAGINLIRSSVSDFGQRPVLASNSENELPVFFGDFVNYWVCRDILKSVELLSHDLGKEIGIDYSPDKLNDFANDLKRDDCWFGYLDGIRSFDDLNDVLKNRIVTYRSYLHFNIDKIPDNITKSKTAIGTPILKTVELLRKHKILADDVKVFVRIDQYEELSWLYPKLVQGSDFKSVINKLLAIRDSSVSFRIGTRPFAWEGDGHEIFGTTARLELDRNYIEISIDDVLRMPENKRGYLFDKYAQDIFRKRLLFYNYNVGVRNQKQELLGQVFGLDMLPEEKIEKYIRTSKEKAIVLEDSWPGEWKGYLKTLANSSPLSARLGEAWARQRGKGDITNHIPTKELPPWEMEDKKYWKKERIDQALFQIASRNNQQLIWQGADTILSLSGGNILAFLNLCQQIWEVWMREDVTPDFDNTIKEIPSISAQIQTLGILQASSIWFKKLSNALGGKERRQFILLLGTSFHRWLLEDKSMSYPGHNGFSLEIQEQEKNSKIDRFLKEASDFGDLQVRDHTTKTKDKRKRVKWYLNPILSPFFKIPVTHQKEPYYATINEVEFWYTTAILNADGLKTGKILNISKKTGTNAKGQISLF
jgi:hypothetical protein